MSEMRAMNAEAQMHAAMGMADMRTWGLEAWVTLFTMWVVMMAAMMLPSAAPIILLVLGLYRRRNEPRARVAAFAFMAGYLATWTLFSAAASVAQLALHQATLVGADMRIGSAAISGVILLIAGAYQWMPVKHLCLTNCQSPFGFLARHWREGTGGALIMGAHHGLFCVGCCWLLMTVLFVVGVMNLFWVAALAGFVLIEKLTRRGAVISRLAGSAIAVWGIYLLVSSRV
jgi:predicted metal-binding membrane protein